MSGSEQRAAQHSTGQRVKTPATEIIDFGVAPLELPPLASQATEVTEFIEEDARRTVEGRPSESQLALLAKAAAEAAQLQTPPAQKKGLIGRFFGFIGWIIRSLFGIASLIVLLSVIVAIPIVNFLVLGYLLEVEGRLARSGRIRDAFPLIDLAPRLGSIVLGIVLWLVPLWTLSHTAADARLIDPGSDTARNLLLVVRVLSVGITIHLCLALARGGGLTCFLRPIKNLRWLIQRLRSGDYWTTAAHEVRTFIDGLSLKHHFWLGFRGYVGAMMWLGIPTLLFAATTKTEGGPIIITLIGGVLLTLVLSWVPFLQAHFAAENRFGAYFELRKVRALFKNAPFSWLITMLITLTLSLPMYLFKVALPPQDALWMETPFFLMSIWPMKVITGWAYHRAVARERRAFFGLRWLTRLVMLPLLVFYVFLLFFTQFIGEHGKLVLFEHHAFLLPVPF